MIRKTFAIVALLAIGVTFAYAEESTVQVPFDYHGQSCWLESATTYQCIWEGEIDPFSLEDLEFYKDVLTDEQYAEEYAKLTAVPEVAEPVELTPEEKKIQKLESIVADGKATLADTTYLSLLKELDECHRGLGNTAAIQDKSSFVISEYIYGINANVEIVGDMGKLLKSIQECHAQYTLEYHVLSEEYANKANGDEDVFYDHYGAWKGIQALDFELYNKNSNRIDMNGICDNNQYDWKNRIMMGCEDTRVYDGTTHKGTSGKIYYFSQVMGEYNEYLQNNSRYATTDELSIEAELAQPILQDMIDSNHFLQNKLKE